MTAFFVPWGRNASHFFLAWLIFCQLHIQKYVLWYDNVTHFVRSRNFSCVRTQANPKPRTFGCCEMKEIKSTSLSKRETRLLLFVLNAFRLQIAYFRRSRHIFVFYHQPKQKQQQQQAAFFDHAQKSLSPAYYRFLPAALAQINVN